MAVRSLPDVPGLAQHGPAFHATFAAAMDRLQFGEPVSDAVCALISHESGFRANAVNKHGGASGLMQWMPRWAPALTGHTVEQIRKLSAFEQLPLVEKTFSSWRGKLPARDVPMVGFGSSFIGKPDDHVAYRKGQPAYDGNAALDINEDGAMTLGEVREHVLRSLRTAATKPRLPVDPSLAVAPSSGSSSSSSSPGLVVIGVGIILAIAAAFFGRGAR